MAILTEHSYYAWVLDQQRVFMSMKHELLCISVVRVGFKRRLIL